MATDREIALEIAIAALLKAARHDKNEIIQRAEGLIDDGALEDVGACAFNQSAASSALKEISARV